MPNTIDTDIIKRQYPPVPHVYTTLQLAGISTMFLFVLGTVPTWIPIIRNAYKKIKISKTKWN